MIERVLLLPSASQNVDRFSSGPMSVDDGIARLCRVDVSSVFGGHRKKEDGLLSWSSFSPRLVLASPRQSHIHVRVLPGAVGVVVVALEPL